MADDSSDANEMNSAIGALLATALVEALVKKGVLSKAEGDALYDKAAEEAASVVSDHRIAGRSHA